MQLYASRDPTLLGELLGKCISHMYRYGFRLPSVLYVLSPSQVELRLILFYMHACLIIISTIVY